MHLLPDSQLIATIATSMIVLSNKEKLMFCRKIVLAVCMLSAALAGGLAQAAVIVVSNTSTIRIHDNADTWAAAVGTIGVDTFDDIDEGELPSSLVRQAGDQSYTVSATQGLWGGVDGGETSLSTTESFDVLDFTDFSSSVRGFAGDFYGTTSSGLALSFATVRLTVVDATGTLIIDFTTERDARFVGFVTKSAIDQITVESFLPIQYFAAADNIALAMAAPVPEPGTVTMLLAGMIVMPWAVRRRLKSH